MTSWNLNTVDGFKSIAIFVCTDAHMIQSLTSGSFFFCVCVFLGPPAAYGDSQARGLIGAIAASQSQSHSNAGSKLLVCDLHHGSWQCWILNPMSKARDGTRNVMVPSQLRLPMSHDGNSSGSFFMLLPDPSSI